MTGVQHQRQVKCVKLGRQADALSQPPLPGELGQRIFEQVSAEAWAGWLEHQKMLVNEYRLNLADSRARKYLREQTERYFFGEGADVAHGYVPPVAADASKPPQMTVSASWSGGAAFAVESGSGHRLSTDGPAEHGGENRGLRPMELLLASVATCSGFDVVNILKRGRHDFSQVRVKAVGQRADKVPAVFESIELLFAVAGAPEDAARRAVQLSVEKYCSALAMISSGTRISWRLAK